MVGDADHTAWVMPTHIVAATGIVLNDAGEFLMVNSPRRGWVFPGGQVEVGENVIDGVRREVMEETGVEIDVGELCCVASNTCTHPGYNGVREVPTKIILTFIGRAVGGVPRPSEENTESAYVPAEAVVERITSPAMRETYQAYLEYAGRPVYLEYVTHPVYQLRVKRLI